MNREERRRGGRARGAAAGDAPALAALFAEALAHHRAGRLGEAERGYRTLLAKAPRHADGLHMRGVLALQTGAPEEAERLIRRALALAPGLAGAKANLGLVLRAQGRLTEALALLEAAHAENPEDAGTLNNLGVVLRESGAPGRARELFARALARDPDSAGAHHNLGTALHALGRIDEATAEYAEAIRLKPGHAAAHDHLGVALQALGRHGDAIAHHERALALDPGSAEAESNLGLAHLALGRLGEAERAFRAALARDAAFAPALNNLGSALKDQGRIEEALAAYQAALKARPRYRAAHSNLLYALTFAPGLDPAAVAEEHRAFGRTWGRGARAADFASRRDPERRLRLGYVSPDFREHSVAAFIEPALAAHDRDRFEVACYANVARPDATSARLKAVAGRWVDIVGLGDEEAAARIRADGIDLLVDLAGHTGENRLGLFALRPAPVQATWIGYPNTTGLAAIGWRITDAIADPPGARDTLYSERLVRLPGCFLCYRPPAAAPEPARAPGPFAFGSFNHLAKLNPRVIAAWAEILRRVPAARLVLKARSLADAETRARVLAAFAQAGVAAERIALHAWIGDPAGHLGLYREVDVALDPFPYNGTTTTCEALWMGVPVVTLAGEAHAGRVGASLLSAAGLPELIAGTADAYVERAVALAADRGRLARLRDGLRRRLAASALTDANAHTRALEAAYREMWRAWCAGDAPT
ncbi:MAG: tetratricopeptide repeat protein [Proteobacteria bacterium]|nr:tetratricopeptide repeat protein [Pseudomonadota bacterium]